MSGEIKVFPVKCQICQREIVDGMIYYSHPEHGFVGECCPQFGDGGIDVKEGEDSE